MSLLKTPARRILESGLRRLTEADEGSVSSVVSGVVSSHSPSCSVTAASTQAPGQFEVTLTGPKESADCLNPNGHGRKPFMDDLRAALHEIGASIASTTYHEDPVGDTHFITSKIFVKIPSYQSL